MKLTHSCILWALSGLIVFTPLQSASALSDILSASMTPPQTGMHALQTVSSDSKALQDREKLGQGALNFIDNMGKRAVSFLGNDKLSKSQKTQSFRKLLKDSFSMSTIGRFALGSNWRKATPKQQKEYQKLFEEMVVRVYSERFSEYDGQNFQVQKFRAEGKRDTIVNSKIVPDTGASIKVDWRVRYKNGQYRVIDVIIEGVSMSLTQRSDFSSVIQRGGGKIDVLLDHLRSQKS